MKNKKGFTLVEILAVIAILAVVMLIAFASIQPITERVRKAAFLDEVKMLYKSAQNALKSTLKAKPGLRFAKKDLT